VLKKFHDEWSAADGSRMNRRRRPKSRIEATWHDSNPRGSAGTQAPDSIADNGACGRSWSSQIALVLADKRRNLQGVVEVAGHVASHR
jgi:hypothetical protein